MTEKRFTFDIDNENGTDDPYFCNGIDSFYVDNADEMESFIKEINELVEENKELQERNNRQAKQLGNIYHLIEKQDWKTLKGIIEEFKECEEQLQSEWGTYGDVE